MAHEGLVLVVEALIEEVLQSSWELSGKEWGVDSPATERRAPLDDFSGVRSGGSVCVLVRCVSFGAAAGGTGCAEGDMTRQFMSKGKYGADKNYGKQHLTPFRSTGLPGDHIAQKGAQEMNRSTGKAKERDRPTKDSDKKTSQDDTSTEETLERRSAQVKRSSGAQKVPRPRREHSYRESGDEETDVLLDVPEVKVDEIELEVENLRASVSLQAEVLDLLTLKVGADVGLGRVGLTIKGVEAQALLKVRLDNVREIIARVLQTIDRNPQILEHVTKGVGGAVEDVGQGAGSAVEDVGQGAGGAVEEVGQGAGGAVEDVGRGAEEAAEGAGKATEEAGRGVGKVAEGTGDAGEDAGRGAGEDAGRGAGEAAGEDAGRGAGEDPDENNMGEDFRALVEHPEDTEQ